MAGVHSSPSPSFWIVRSRSGGNESGAVTATASPAAPWGEETSPRQTTQEPTQCPRRLAPAPAPGFSHSLL